MFGHKKGVSAVNLAALSVNVIIVSKEAQLEHINRLITN
jgi:hypothetical protein